MKSFELNIDYFINLKNHKLSPIIYLYIFYSNMFRIIKHVSHYHRVDKTYRDVTDRCKHCGRLRYHVPTFFQAIGRKMINCACSASLKWVVIRLSSNQMHASSNLPSMRTKKVGTLVTSLYVSTLWHYWGTYMM